uniref:Activating signal cointegrator 1 complex subunit 2 n=1 Tax=Rousettus aegyptiacus TaxID=9407 RepID=A0A7J8GWQ9_ROUAE|nr:activating signal cointegrator 1 complex subunit 2 [Rousettus aegyptiacus]
MPALPLDSYLHYVPRKFDEWVAPTPEVVDMQKRLHRSVFLTFLRMSTHKESKDHFISPSAFGEILYNNFLQIFSSLLQEKRFLRDYDVLFPVADDVSLLQQASSALLDETRTAYILQAIESAWEGVDRQKATDAKDPPVAEDFNGVVATAEKGRRRKMRTKRKLKTRPPSLTILCRTLQCCGKKQKPGAWPSSPGRGTGMTAQQQWPVVPGVMGRSAKASLPNLCSKTPLPFSLDSRKPVYSKRKKKKVCE